MDQLRSMLSKVDQLAGAAALRERKNQMLVEPPNDAKELRSWWVIIGTAEIADNLYGEYLDVLIPLSEFFHQKVKQFEVREELWSRHLLLPNGGVFHKEFLVLKAISTCIYETLDDFVHSPEFTQHEDPIRDEIYELIDVAMTLAELAIDLLSAIE